MADLDQDNKRNLSNSDLENQLTIKQMQLKCLLAITQAINENISADSLYEMYKTFINWDLKVEKMLFILREQDLWASVADIGIDIDILNYGLLERLMQYKKLTYLDECEDPILQSFDVVLPVIHKNQPLSFTLLKGKWEDSTDGKLLHFLQTVANIITVAIENKRLFREQLKQERWNKNIQLASEVQDMFIPKKLPTTDKYQLDSIYKPHFDIGGDYFDYFKLSDHEFIFCIADVSGKGVGAAMLMANFQALLHSKISKYKNKSLSIIVEELNQDVYTITQSDKFISFAIISINTLSRQLSYINAGHCPILIAHEDGQEFLFAECTVLGAVRQYFTQESPLIDYAPGTLIMAYTDGLIELRNENDEFFDEDCIWTFGYTYRHLDAQSFNKNLIQRLDHFRGRKGYEDDIAVITCKLL